MTVNYHSYIMSKPSERLDYFLETLAITNRTPDYYVNWEKVARDVYKRQV